MTYESVRLLVPALELLPEYVAALERGWSSDNLRVANEIPREELDRIRSDPAAFVAQLAEPVTGEPISLPDGSTVPRLPGFRRWIWDGSFCGTISFKWQPGTTDLPAYALGHIAYAVVPWKRGRGCAKAALALLLPELRNTGLEFVELITAPTNVASQAVILANGGQLVEQFREPPVYGSREALRFRITL